jgi:hypothetical protein
VQQSLGLDDASVRDRLLELRRAADEAHAALDEARQRDDLPTLDLKLVDEWPDLTVDEKRHLLRAGLERVTVSRGRAPVEERVTVRWRGEGS